MYGGAGQFGPAGTRGDDPTQGIGGYDGKDRISDEACDDSFQRPRDAGDNGHRAALDRRGYRRTEIR